jgi:hypothetical protein
MTMWDMPLGDDVGGRDEKKPRGFETDGKQRIGYSKSSTVSAIASDNQLECP